MPELFPVAVGVVVDISKAINMVIGRKPNLRINIEEASGCIRRGFVSVKYNHVYKGQLKKTPLIVVEIAGVNVVIDGWHRIARARWQGVKKYLWAHKLSDNEFRSIAVPERFVRL